MDHNEKLKDALVRVGDESELGLLNTQAKNLTKSEMTDILNGKNHHGISFATVSAIRKLAKARIKEGKTVFPWDSMEDLELNEADDNMGGGVW